MANTTTLTPSRRSAVTASSRARTRLTGLTAANFTSLLFARRNEPLVGEREELVRVDLHAPHLPVVRAVVGERPKESVGLLLGEDRVELAVDRPALLEVEREKDVLLPRLPLLEPDRDRDPDVLEVILEREHDALDRFALLLDRDLERQRQFLAALLHDAVGARLEAGLGEQRARALGVERQRLDVEVVRPAAGRERAGDDRALAVEERVEHLLAVDRDRDRLAHAPVR